MKRKRDSYLKRAKTSRMKGLSFLEKVIFIINSFAALLLLLSYGLSYLPPKEFGVLSVLSLGVPVLIIFNVLFSVFWLFKLKRQVLLSSIVLLLGINYLTSMYQLTSDFDRYLLVTINGKGADKPAKEKDYF